MCIGWELEKLRGKVNIQNVTVYTLNRDLDWK